MTDHLLEAHFDLTSNQKNSPSGLNSQKIIEDIIAKMALAICPPGTDLNMVPPSIFNEAWKVYLMINAMSAALDEIRNNVK
jgi:hypothetical protein